MTFLLLGLGSGATYGAMASALCVTFRSSGVVNLATGAIALYVAYTFGLLRQGQLLIPIPGLHETLELSRGPINVPIAIAISLAVAAGLGLLLYGLVFRPLRRASPVAKAVASAGIMLVVQALLAARVGTTPVSVASILPNGRLAIGGNQVPVDRLWFAGLILAIAGLLVALTRFTRFGLATRAVAESERGAFVTGLSPDRIAAINWALSAVVAGISGILIAPIVPLVPIAYTLFIVPALAAAMVGRFSNIGLAAVAGLAIGMIQSELVDLQSTSWTWLPSSGVSELVPLAVILVLLVLGSGGIPRRAGVAERLIGRAPIPRNIPTAAMIGVSIGVIALLITSQSWRAAVLTSMIVSVLALSQVVVTGYAGQVSLCQLTLAGSSAFVLGKMTENLSLPFPISMLISATVATLLGILVGVPALRIRGLTFAVATLALAIAVEGVWFLNPSLNGGTAGETIKAPTFLGLNLSIGSGLGYPRLPFCLMVLTTLAVVATGVALLRRSSLGGKMLAVRANERSAAASGIDVSRVKIIAFAISGFIAGLAGALMGYQEQVAVDGNFATLTGIALFAVFYLAGVNSIVGGIVAGVVAEGGLIYVLVNRWLHLGEYYAVVSGLFLILTVIRNPEGVVAPIHHALDKLWGRYRAVVSTTPSVADVSLASLSRAAGLAEELLSVEGITVTYGGVVALEDVTFVVNRGEILGVIGPNGAGKTTLIDSISGFAEYAGRVSLLGRKLEGLPPFRRIRSGLGRTFQSIELYDDLTVEENVRVGNNVTRSDADQARDRFLEILGLIPVRDRLVCELSQGQRQLVSVARSLAGQPDVLLLDEPAAGLDSAESGWLGQRLKAVRDSGTTVVLVDHDMGLVLEVCDRIVVLDLGRKIADDVPAIVQRDPAVIAAYLGSTHAQDDQLPQLPRDSEEVST